MEVINEYYKDEMDSDLHSLDAANYLNKELLKQIDTLKNDNHQVK